uniref:Uncharacterized protein n=1 Tax=Human betaherpesvirus 6 TaxID=10368 RepID=A0A1W6G929_9BETA|nr:hypothetical protein [Human betaherpesvirus 6]ARM08612.1 hypothetical protein [Human betaherpesvirus 6]ARM09102.1 hypothetical protein [Human betaherpesvirus 6]ARM09461.1 hypothetical protein [Human betaherpesvirus 6]ARM09820.1 hypothetical protein [Human betaherpesvirus 6]
MLTKSRHILAFPEIKASVTPSFLFSQNLTAKKRQRKASQKTYKETNLCHFIYYKQTCILVE